MPRPLTLPQQAMMSEITDSICVMTLSGAMTPAEARDVLQRLVGWLERVEAGGREPEAGIRYQGVGNGAG